MATDYALMTRNLHAFYDFAGRTLVSIGAGGGQMVAPGHPARRIVAIDQDPSALEQLRATVIRQGLEGTFELVLGDFLTMDLPAKGDVALFEFCLHEMADVPLALRRAALLAPDVVVFDHGVESEWAWYVMEEDKVARSWKALEGLPVVRRRVHACAQRFKDHAELLAKVAVQGEEALRRAERFRGTTDIVIPMTYEMALLRFP